jgi:hypothetical protein
MTGILSGWNFCALARGLAFGGRRALSAAAAVFGQKAEQRGHGFELRGVDHGAAIAADGDKPSGSKPIKVEGQGIRSEIERGGYGASGHSLGSGLYEQAEHIEPIILSESGKCRDCFGLFHISTNMEIIGGRQGSFQWSLKYLPRPARPASIFLVFASRASDAMQHMCCEPGPFYLCMGLFSIFLSSPAAPPKGAQCRVPAADSSRSRDESIPLQHITPWRAPPASISSCRPVRLLHVWSSSRWLPPVSIAHIDFLENVAKIKRYKNRVVSMTPGRYREVNYLSRANS